jgi:uncharacterized membrane protein
MYSVINGIIGVAQLSAQYTWRLNSIIVILVPFVTAWFVQRHGNAGILRSKTFCAAVFAPLLYMHTAHNAGIVEKCYFGH